MKLFNVTNVEKFFETVDACEGKVELVSEQGDVINLKSNLSKYFAFANILTTDMIDELELKTYNEKDTQKFMKLMREGI